MIASTTGLTVLLTASVCDNGMILALAYVDSIEHTYLISVVL